MILTSVISTVSNQTPQPLTTSNISLRTCSRSALRFLRIWSIVEFAIAVRTMAEDIDTRLAFAITGLPLARSSPKFLYALKGPSPCLLIDQTSMPSTRTPYISVVTCSVENTTLLTLLGNRATWSKGPLKVLKPTPAFFILPLLRIKTHWFASPDTWRLLM